MILFESCRYGGLLAEMSRPVWAPLSVAKGLVLPMLILLFAGHALCDFPLQGQFLSDAKNHNMPIAGVPWGWALFAHSLIHCGMVYLVTASIALALAELLIHAATDYAKSSDSITFTQDQAIHYGCKLLWAVIACGVIHA